MSETCPHIVILDDNYRVLAPYIEELECLDIKVSIASNIPEFNNVLSKSEQIDLLVIDVMLPPSGSNFSELATDYGLKTGLLVAKALREKEIETPIIFFSVAWLSPIIEDIKNTEKRVNNSVYLQKQSIFPRDFAYFVQAVLRKGKVPGILSKVYRKLVDSLILKPACFGFGIDIKKLME